MKLTMLCENLEVKLKGIIDGELIVLISGKEYGYMPNIGDPNELASKFRQILIHSPGKALQWLKKNAKLTSGGKEKQPTLF